jgi:uncharacterized protein
MSAVFADTFFWIALLNRKDSSHPRAVELSRSLQGAVIVTTEEVLTQVLNYFAGAGSRTRSRVTASVYRILEDANTRVVTQSHDSFMNGLEFYASRPDKGYSFVDFISMNVMKAEKLSNVLTEDEHFLQQGFNALFRLPDLM